MSKSVNEQVYEYCPHCETEVGLENEFKVQKCPNCGQYIVPCNLCPIDCVSKCPLELLCNELNMVQKDNNQKDLKKFIVNQYYEYRGSVIVEAETKEEALEKAQNILDEMTINDLSFIDTKDTEIISNDDIDFVLFKDNI